jgi:ubiquinone/menaquinone biosynthesis C-methylase UbiE
MREEIVSQARGETLEIGGGTGLNLAHYPEAVTALTIIEPDPFMAKRLRAKLEAGAAPVKAELIEASAEELPFGDASFDTVVGTLVMCTIPNPDRAVAEIARVLRPAGRLLLIEHVRDPHEGRLARWQDRLERPWGWFAGGCHPNRPTDQSLAGAGFWVDSLERGTLPKAPPLARPLIRGVARRPSGPDSD